MKRILIVFITLASLLWSCRGEDPVSPPEETVPLIPEQEITGKVSLPNNAAIQIDQIEVLSAVGKANVSISGDFQGMAVAGAKQQIILARSKSSGKPVLLGYFSPDSSQLEISARSTALALVMLNPMLFSVSKEERDRMASRVLIHSRFDAFVQLIDGLLQSTPDAVLDATLHPDIYQLAIEIGNATLKSFSNTPDIAPEKVFSALSDSDVPTVENAAGNNVTFVNPRTIFYCSGIYNGGYAERAPDQMVILDAKESLVSVRLGWPPVVYTQPTRTDHEIGRGQFYIRIESGTRTGFDFDRMLAETPEGYAFRANSLKAIGFVIDWLVGWDFLGNRELFSFGGLARFSMTVESFYEIGHAFASGKPMDAFIAIVTFVEENHQSIGLYLWQQGFENVTSDFMEQVAKIAGAVSVAFKIISAGNEQVPFVYDWITAPPVVDYCIDKNGSNFSDCGINSPPSAYFVVSPLAGDVSTQFTFNASGTRDNIDSPSEIQVRWDFDGDNNWDTNWSTNKHATHSYPTRDSYTVFLEARDTRGLSAITHTIVNVSGGFASGKHIVIFRDVLPWQNVRIEELLAAHGFTEGNGTDQFEIQPSSQMSTLPLLTGETFVIIGNSQDQNFYNNYAANNLRFANFVYNGGTIFWEACDRGWYNNDSRNYGGDMRVAGVVIPGNIGTIFDYDKFNYVTDPSLPLVKDLPTIIEHNYASHESFTNLPEGTTIYMVNEVNEPTLIEYKYGGGWIVATGQPIEHGYYLGKELGLLLPRVVSYVLGKSATVAVTLPKRTPEEMAISSASADTKKTNRSIQQ